MTARFNNNDKNQARLLNIIGKIYELDQNDKKAISNYKNALVNAKYSKSKSLEAELRNSLGQLLIKSDSTLSNGIKLYIESYELAKTIKDTTKMIQPLLNLAGYYISQDDYATAYTEYLSPARVLIGQNSTNLEKSKLNILLGKYFLSVRRYERSDEYFEKGINIALQQIDKIKTPKQGENNKLLSNFYNELVHAYRSRSNLFKEQKDFEKSHNYLEQHITFSDKYNDILKGIELQRANIKFNVGELKDQVEQSKVKQKQRDSEEIKWQISILLGIVVILISMAFLISAYKNNIQKRKLNNTLIENNKELINAKETAEQVSTLKSQFISTVSHELRTPLYGVIGLTSLLMENPEEKKKNEYLDSLKFSGDYLLALINDVLQLSKIETNEVKLEKVSFDIKSLIEGIVNSLHSKQKHNNNKVHINIDSKIKTTLLGDSVRLSQILINLIGNALKFTKNGNIWVTVTCLEYENNHYSLRFIIKDDGIGIPKSKQETIFDNFAQVKNQNQEYEGTGLGLAIVKKLVHLHNSEIIISSEEGVGSEFTFDLSYDKAIKVTDNSSTLGDSISIGTSNFNILIVDDNRINQIVTKNILKKKGYTCDLANNGMDSIEMLKNEEYDLVLMDINMPEMNGLDATTVIRTFNTHIPIIALTAVEEGEVRDQALSVGMNDVIIKPYDTQQFFQTIMKNISKVQRV
ncbi:ATP-binding protein [Aquimarina addita]|uniref:histidine kinase n=1 Tax=Aquimarina addita TaxID=870485 RepID=A0ABP6UHV0_9FLAO